jgi:hypothetical protein
MADFIPQLIPPAFLAMVIAMIGLACRARTRGPGWTWYRSEIETSGPTYAMIGADPLELGAVIGPPAAARGG